MDSISKQLEKIDNLTIRERGAILLALLVVLFYVWNTFFMQPIQNQQKIIKSELQQKQANQTVLNVQLQKLIEDNSKDPTPELEKKLQQLKGELENINSEIRVSTAHLVSPKNMARILETVLNKTRGLTLVSARGLGATSLIQDDKVKTSGMANKNDMGNAYKHGLRLEFEGDYMTTLRYLHELESLEWKFFWDSFEYNVKEYPKAKAVIQVFTLSLDKDWIDV